MPQALRLTGCWLLWSAWCSLSGWGLSAIGQLSGLGHLILLPILLAAFWIWLRATASARNDFSNFKKWRFRMGQPVATIYLLIVVLSLLGALLNSHPWSIDAFGYRLPRMFYWWSAHHWYWMGALDHRLDFSSIGFEWQMLPVTELTHSLRFLFLLNWIPFLLLPWLVFIAFRHLGVNGRSARRWMWLLPSAYCIALQSGGMQNDGYAVNYLLASVAFAGFAFYSRRVAGLWFAILAAALLTSAKLSNLPLLLPLVVVCLPLFRRVPWLNWKLVEVGVVAVMCSFAPMAFLCWQNTGDWKGDPSDQFQVKTHGPIGAMTANLIFLARDSLQPPISPGSARINANLKAFNQSPFIKRLHQSHGEFNGIGFGEMVDEGGAGAGFGLAFYLVFLLMSCLVTKRALPRPISFVSVPWEWRLAPCLAWIAYAVYLAELGSYHSARLAAPYYPLLIVSLLRLPRIGLVERTKISGFVAGCAAATVIPIILLTPARPLVPVQTLARLTGSSALGRIAEKYRFWEYVRDDLGPLREKIPEGVAQLGFAGGLHNPSTDLWLPLGSRAIVELGLPPGPHAPLPPPDLEYAVVTDNGLSERYNLSLEEWLAATHGHVVFEYYHNTELDAHNAPTYEIVYLVKLRP